MRLAHFLKVAKMIPSYNLACSIILFHFPELDRKALPKLQFHGTLKRALAYCYFDKNVILASKKHYTKNRDVFANEVWLHELAHFVANKLYSCQDHGKAWQSICQQIGIQPREAIEVWL